MRLYNNNEVRAILKKAAENSSIENEEDQIGLTIDELRMLAKDAGLDPEQIVRAASELDEKVVGTDQNFWGGPFSYRTQIIVDDSIDSGQWEEMLLKIRDFFKVTGDVNIRESAYEWSSPWDSTNSAQITASKLDNKTKLSVDWRGPLTAIPYYLPVPLMGLITYFGVSGVFEWSTSFAVGASIIISGLSFIVARWKLRKNLRIGFNKLRSLLTELEDIATSKDSTKEAVNLETEKDLNSKRISMTTDEYTNESNMETSRRGRENN